MQGEILYPTTRVSNGNVNQWSPNVLKRNWFPKANADWEEFAVSSLVLDKNKNSNCKSISFVYYYGE